MKRGMTIATGLLTAALILAGCSRDSAGPNNEFGTVSGTIDFVGNWPSSGDVQVSLYSSFPPMGPPDYSTEPLTPGVSSFAYKIEGITKGDYAAVVVGWRDPANPAGAKIIGFYLGGTDQTGVDASGNPTAAPLPVSISDGTLNLTSIDIKADLDVAP